MADAPENRSHTPVMPDEVLAYLDPRPGKLYVDATLGAGGHAELLLDRLARDGRLIGIDRDRAVLDETSQRLTKYPNFTGIHGNYSDLPVLLKTAGAGMITGGVLADLGVSSMQLDQAGRGFSFRKEAPLDMRMNPDADTGKTAADIVNTYSETDLVRIFSEYGEERFSKTIAREIIQHRPFSTTTQLAGLIQRIYDARLKRKHYRVHPATCVFQALRIEVNDELRHLERFLKTLPEVLAPGARVVVISFHSLEDRIVKNAFRDLYQNSGPLDILTKKPVTPTDAEVTRNPRARSAKLRAAERR